MRSMISCVLFGAVLVVFSGCSQKSAKLQRSVVPPDKTLFETASDYLDKNNYIRARLAFQNLISTYPDSELTPLSYFAMADSFYEEGTLFPALPPSNALREIPFATGSLGHGLSLCAGMALGAILNRNERRFFCLTSDGELDEGSVWEAALFVAHRKLANVVWLIDRNRIQGIGRTEEVMALEPLDAKLRAFGFHVVAADGHDFTSLLAARSLPFSRI